MTLGALVAIVVGLVVANSVGRPAVPIKLPNPNGYDDLVRAGSMVKGPWPADGNLAKAPLLEVRAFVAANRGALDLARVGLGRECMVPLENSVAGIEKHFEALSPIRAVGRLLQGEAMIAEADGRIVDAAKAHRDGLTLGQAVTRGGLSVDQQVGCQVQWLAVIGLRKLSDRIPAGEIPAILRELEDLDKKRVPLEDIEARQLAWQQGANNVLIRTMYRLNGMEKTAQIAERKSVQDARVRVIRDLRFLAVELAIHAYHEDLKVWPRSIQDLVPKYLPAHPIDPGTGKPIDYPANAAGDLTDDLGTIGRPDGEVTTPKP